MFQIKLTGKSKQTLKLIHELPERTKAFFEIIARDVAQSIMREVYAGIPPGNEYTSYREGLRARKVSGTAPGTSAWLVDVKTSRVRIRDIDQKQTVIYVKPRRSTNYRSKPWVSVLVRHSPWTASTIPIYPSNKDAKVIVRRVSSREYVYVEGQRKKDKRVWSVSLAKAGIVVDNERDQRTEKDIVATEDLAFLAMRVEFGGGGRRAHPHWRPAIRRFYRGMFVRYFKRNKAWRKVLTNAHYRKWKMRKKSARVGIGRLRRYAKFQKAVVKGL